MYMEIAIFVLAFGWVYTYKRLLAERAVAEMTRTILNKTVFTIKMAGQAFEDGEDKIGRAWIERMAPDFADIEVEVMIP